jgi:hypothetical protein
VCVYVDDLLITSESTLFKEHIADIQKVLALLEKAGFKIKAKKLQIAPEQLDFLGMTVSRSRLSIPDIKLQAIEAIPRPRTARQIKSFLGICSFFRSWLRGYAHMSQPLHKLAAECTNNKKKIVWLQVHEDSFLAIKDAIKHNNVRFIPDTSGDYILETDASNLALGIAVYQMSAEKELRLIIAQSRTLSTSERNYPMVKLEACSISSSLIALRALLLHANSILIRTDARCLLYLALGRNGSSLLYRYCLLVSSYQASVVHIAGKDNVMADKFSRLPYDEEPEEKLPFLTEKEAAAITNRMRIPNGTCFSVKEVQQLLCADSPLSVIHKKVRTKVNPPEPSFEDKNFPTIHTPKARKMPKNVYERPHIIHETPGPAYPRDIQVGQATLPNMAPDHLTPATGTTLLQQINAVTTRSGKNPSSRRQARRRRIRGRSQSQTRPFSQGTQTNADPADNEPRDEELIQEAHVPAEAAVQPSQDADLTVAWKGEPLPPRQELDTPPDQQNLGQEDTVHFPDDSKLMSTGIITPAEFADAQELDIEIGRASCRERV